jgi:hypothetical protein
MLSSVSPPPKSPIASNLTSKSPVASEYVGHTYEAAEKSAELSA